MKQSATIQRNLSVTRLLSISVAARIVVDTSVQIFSPFLPMIAAGLGTNVVVMGRLVAIRSAMGLFSPLFGAAADRGSYRRVMQLGLLCGATGMTVLGLSTSVWMAALGMVFAGLCFASFTPTLQAYVSARLPYHRRARGLGILEYSWAITGIAGLFLVGQIIERSSWRVPFFLLGAGMLVSAAVFGILPPAGHRSSQEAIRGEGGDSISPFTPSSRRFVAFFHLGENARSAYGTIAVNFCLMFSAVQFMIIYGAWLNGEYGLSASQLGVVALVFGLFDLAASVSVSLFTDSIGKRRSVLLGSLCVLAGYVLIPFFNVGVLAAVLSLAVTRCFFEFSVVANIPLLSEQSPHQRGKVMTLSAAISMMAVTLASFTGPWIYTEYGVPLVAVVSAASALTGIVVLALFVKEPAA